MGTAGAAGGSPRGRPGSTTGRAVALVWRADRSGVLVSAGFQVLGALAGLALVLAVKLALEAVLAPDEVPTGRLVLALALLAGASALSGSVGALQAQQQRVLGERVGQHIWARLLAVCAAVDLATYESGWFARRLDRVTGNALDRPVGVGAALLGLLGGLVSVLGLVVALLAVDPLLVPLLVAAGVPAVLLSRRSSVAEFDFTAGVTDTARRRVYLRSVLSSRDSAAEVRAFGAAGELLRRHARDDRTFLDRLVVLVRRRQLQSLATTGAAALALALTLLVIVALVRAGRITLADAGAAAVAARLLGAQLAGVFGAVGTLVEDGPFLLDLEDFLALAPPPAEPGRCRALTDVLRATDLRFRYEGRDVPAVDGVSVALRAGTVVALVGENGSGKTTLAKLLCGLYPPEAGTLSWDGRAGVPAADLRASVSVVFQDFVRYQLSVLDNITISDTGRPVDRGRAERAVERVGLGPAVAALPAGLDTVLGRELVEGSDLSGGQWQRLALARALYRDTSVLVMDEPSAALDPRAEHELFADVRRVLAGRAGLLVSHRYSSVRLADYIYVLAHGRVVEEGTHDQLVAAAGHYAELYALQAVAYLPTGSDPDRPGRADRSPG